MAGIVLAPEFLAIFNVGDSRVYALQANTLEMISVDHVAPTDRRTLERFIGGDGLHSLPAVRNIQFDPGTRILLCTDGLYDVVDDDRIKELLGQSDTVFAARCLIAACLERGAPDNVSVAICDFIAGRTI